MTYSINPSSGNITVACQIGPFIDSILCVKDGSGCYTNWKAQTFLEIGDCMAQPLFQLNTG